MIDVITEYESRSKYIDTIKDKKLKQQGLVTNDNLF